MFYWHQSKEKKFVLDSCVYQSILTRGEPPKIYLIRVFVDLDNDPAEVVTVYLTSKIKKYWR